MKLTIEQSSTYKEPEIKILCNCLDSRLSRLVEQIHFISYSIKVRHNSAILSLALDNVLYFDAVDNRVYAYTEQGVYQCDKKLYEIEEAYKNTPLIRISKNCICNIHSVSAVRTLLSGKMEATLKNGEKVLISRHYIKLFRNKFLQEN